MFNQYADPLGYFEICLEIFQAADFRQTSEITQCWEAIIRKGIRLLTIPSKLAEHENSEAKQAGEPFEGVADAIRRLGRKFLKYELIFNPATLVPMVEKYNLETIQRDGWVPEAFLDAGMIPSRSIHYNVNMFRSNSSTAVFDLRQHQRPPGNSLERGIRQTFDGDRYSLDGKVVA